jgi:predicted ArsR family transcriptional regulator
MDREGPSNYRLLAAMLTQHLEATATEPAGTAIALGRAWGPALVRPTTDSGTMRKDGAVTRMVRVLDELGFKPEPVKSARTRQIRLRHCPFLDLVDDHEVICSIHLGLMQGVMAGEGNGSLTVGRLDPFVEPDLCVAHLTRMQA